MIYAKRFRKSIGKYESNYIMSNSWDVNYTSLLQLLLNSPGTEIFPSHPIFFQQLFPGEKLPISNSFAKMKSTDRTFLKNEFFYWKKFKT